MKFQFTYTALREQFKIALEHGYSVLTCADFVQSKGAGTLPAKTLVNRVDIDYSVKKAERIGQIMDSLDIKASFFVRLHAHEYNPFSFENYRIIKGLIQSGHEVGYHAEIVDEAAIWGEPAADCLQRDIDVFNRIFNIKMQGVASHGGMTGLNNLDFWEDRDPSEFGLLYEAYDRRPENDLFRSSRYVSDSEWTRWKSYENGQLLDGDHRSIAEHLLDNPSIVYTLIHSDTYYDKHFYE